MKKIMLILTTLGILLSIGTYSTTVAATNTTLDLKPKSTIEKPIPVVQKGIIFNKKSYHRGEMVNMTITTGKKKAETLMLTMINPKDRVLIATEIRTNKSGIFTLSLPAYGPYGQYEVYTLDNQDGVMKGSFQLTRNLEKPIVVK